jgi:cytochrome P450
MPRDLTWFREKRCCTPIWLDPDDSVWNIYRYSDVVGVLSDHATFSSDFSSVLHEQALDELAEGNIVVTDPPRHQQLRALVTQAFSPRAVAALEPTIAAATNELLDAAEAGDDGHLELISQLAYPLPVTIISGMLGVPASDRHQFKVWADALLDRSLEEANDLRRQDSAVAELRHFHDYMREQVADRRVQPRADLLSDLIAARVDDQTLSDSEIVGFATILLIAGHITTTLLLGNAVLCLKANAVAERAVRSDHTAIPGVIEETMRYCSPVRVTRRITTREADIRGVQIPAKQMVNVWLGSANRDERQFDRPDEFIYNRAHNPHLGFGGGIHFCLGAPLARCEAKVALTLLLRRYPTLHLDPAHAPDMYASTVFAGARRLDLQR